MNEVLILNKRPHKFKKFFVTNLLKYGIIGHLKYLKKKTERFNLKSLEVTIGDFSQIRIYWCLF